MNHKSPSITQIQCTIVGGPQVGRAVLNRIIYNSFFQPYDPSHESWRVLSHFNGNPFNINFDISMTQYTTLEPLWYQQADVLVVCVSLVDPASCEYAMAKVQRLIHQYAPTTPIILLGTKDTVHHVSDNQLAAMSHILRSPAPHICSAKLDKGVQELTDVVIRQFLNKQSVPLGKQGSNKTFRTGRLNEGRVF
ncbi:P-loop containing nucleoside triphosphate hydrolase protein, partial [Flagelloscypha sp. PMI_526]